MVVRTGADSVRDEPPVTTSAENAVHAILGLAVVTAVYADGRAHILGLPDSFFTPWHAFLYGGLTLMVIWLAVMSWLSSRRSGSRSLSVVPAGYRPAVVGAGLFAVGGVADLAWHLAFGVEFGIDALLSPSHLLLFVGGSLLFSGPLLAHRARSHTVSPAPALLSVIGITLVAAFALSYLSAFLSEAPTMPLAREPEGTAAHLVAEGLAAAGLGSFLVTTVLLVVPTIYLLRSGVWFPGSVTALLTIVAAYAISLTGFENPASILAVLVTGAVVDGLLIAIRPHVRGRVIELVVGGTLPLVLWSGQLVTIAIAFGLGWSEAMATGAVLLSATVGVVIVLALTSVDAAGTGSSPNDLPGGAPPRHFTASVAARSRSGSHSGC